MSAKIKLTIQSNFNEASKELKNFGTLTEKEAERINKALKRVKSQSVDDFIAKNKRAGIAIQTTRGKLEGLTASHRGLQRRMETLIRNGMKPEDEALQKLQKEYIQTAKSIEKMEQAQNASTKAMDLAKKSAVALGVALVALAGYGTKSQADYAKELANVNTLIDISASQFKNLDSSVEDLSNTFAIQKKELGAGVYQAVSAGANTLAEALDIVEASAKLGKSALVETSQAVDIITGAMNAYGKEVMSASKASDIYFQIIKKGKINGEQLSSTIGQSITLFSSMGISMEDLGAGIATMTKVNVKASEATTQLNAVVSAFLKPSEAMTEALENAGYASGSALLEQEGLAGAMKFLQKETGGSKEAMAKLLPNIRALRGALALGSQEGELFNQVLQDFSSSKVAGATDEALKRQTDGYAKNVFTVEQSIVAFQNLAMAIGEKVLPVLGKMSQFFVTAVTDFNSLSFPVKMLIKLLPVLALGITAVIVALNAGTIITGVTVAIETLTGAFGALNAIMLANPAGVVIAGIAGIALAINGLTDIIVGNMNAQSDALNSWAGADEEAKKKMIGNLEEYQRLQELGKERTKEETKAMKALGKAMKATTGAKVKYNKETKQATLETKWSTQSVKSLSNEVRVSGIIAEKRAKQASEIAKQRDKEDKANIEAINKAKEAEKSKAEAQKLAQLQWKKGAEEALKLREELEKKALLSTMSSTEQEVYLIEEKFKKEEALLLKYYGKGTKALEELKAERAKALEEATSGGSGGGSGGEEKALSERLKNKQVLEYQAQQTSLQALSNYYTLRTDMENVASENKIAFLQSEMQKIQEMENLNDEEKLLAKKALEEKIAQIEKTAEANADARAQARFDRYQSTTQALSNLFGDLDSIMKNAGKKSKAFAVLQKSMAIAMIAIDTARAIMATATMGFPQAIPFIALATATGVASAVKVATTPIPSAETGGRFEVPETNIHRSDGTVMNLNPGETAEVTPRGEEHKKNLTTNVVLNDEVLWSSTQRGIDSGVITFTNDNLVGV